MMKNSTGKGELVRDQILIVLISGGCAVTVNLCGLLALRLQAGRAVAPKLFTVIMATVLAMATGALGTAQAMFLTQHDCGVVLVVCVAVAVCSVSLGIPLARSLTSDSRALGDALRALDATAPTIATTTTTTTTTTMAGARTGSGLATAELEELRRVLADTSARLTESRDRERALARSRRELVAWVSHDLRTPLAELLAMAEASEDGIATNPRRYHTQMRTSVDQLAAMVDDLAEMSSAHAGALRLSLTSVPLADLVGRAMLAASPLAQTCGVTLSSAVLTPIAVRVDSRELSRALDGLLTTAIRRTPRQGSVRIEAAERDGRAILTVTHTRLGTPDDDTARALATPRIGTSAQATQPPIDSKRGLTFVRGIVEAHSGDITVHDTTDSSCIEVRLPIPASADHYPHATVDQCDQFGQPTRPIRPIQPGQLGQPSRPAVTLLRKRRTP
jgi:signal transduction histidine kinase